MSVKTIVMFIVLASVPAMSQNTPVKSKTSPSPEIAKTVEAINGTWLGKMTASVPGFPAETFEWAMNCKTVAMGAGVSCTNTGKASIGTMAESCLLAFDPEGQAVHYMCVTSMGEVHDHKGRWKDARTIEFEPLRAGMMGQQVTETIRWFFPDPSTLEKTSIVTMPDGRAMSFDFRGKRQ